MALSINSTYEIRLACYKSTSHKLLKASKARFIEEMWTKRASMRSHHRANDEVASRLLVNCHDVIDDIFDLWISRQTGMKSPSKWHNQLWKKKDLQKVHYEVFDLASLKCHVTLDRNWIELHFGTVLRDKLQHWPHLWTHFVSMRKSCSKLNSLAKYHGYWNLNLCQCKVLSNTVPVSDRWRNRLGTQEGKYCGLTIYRVSLKYCQGVYYFSVSTSLTSFPLANIDTDIELKKQQQWQTTNSNGPRLWRFTYTPCHSIVSWM